MARAEVFSTNDIDAALVTCLRILARRGRVIREQKQTMDFQQSLVARQELVATDARPDEYKARGDNLP